MISKVIQQSPLFTVVIPNYERTTQLIRAINSIREQTKYSQLVDKIIIVDDNSENISEIEKIIFDYHDPKIVLVKNKQKSNAAATRNQGARIATTTWVCFLDSDDAYQQNKFVALSELVKDDVDVLYNKAQVYFNGEIEDVVPHRPLYKNEHTSTYLFVYGQYMQTSMLTVKRSFFEKNGFNEKYIRHQDYDLCLTFSEKKLNIQYADFIGTSIFWNANERPNSKGESYSYSLNWLEDNKNRITVEAYKHFYFNFIVVKAARDGAKLQSLKYFLKMKDKQVRIKKFLTYGLLLAIPIRFQHWAYIKYKKVKVHVKKKELYKNIKR